ncbi:MAG: S41 family peptidase [Flavobacteriaceae bacterium]|nr:S41 family peptidase [Flavobacteriaceae bacterium]MDG2275422.1 S41 family peptidase [Flavobacteriaceae bacterium]
MHKQPIKKQAIVALVVGAIVLSFSFKSNFFEVAKQLEIYTTLFKELNLYYINEINPAEFTNKAIKNTLKELDPYTNYFDEQEVEEARIRREGAYSGIGVSVFYDKKGIVLNEIYKDYEADKKGLKAGDIIIKVGNQSLKNMDRDQLSEILKGAPNTSLEIAVLRQGEVKNFRVVTEKVQINPVPFYDLIDKETGYIVLTRFNQKASSEVKKAFLELKKRGMKNLVFDLRGNPGGSLGEAINISNFFLPKGSKITATKAKVRKWSNTYNASNTPLDLEIPLTVLLNERSASASEIVAGALQDYDRAVILGERSFGKGLVQRYMNLSYGTQLKLTISKYYTPSGRCIQELDYASRDNQGQVPKFSDGTVTSFKTKNGRVVFDGGGITPDVEVGFSKRSEATKDLIKSRAIFNFTTDYFYRNPTISSVTDFSLSSSDFKSFLNYLTLSDTVFLTTQERLFLDAYNSSGETTFIAKEFQQLKKKLLQEKISKISKNQDYLSEIIKDEILIRYYYKNGSYLNKLKKDTVILEAVKFLKNKSLYAKVLKGA